MEDPWTPRSVTSRAESPTSPTALPEDRNTWSSLEHLEEPGRPAVTWNPWMNLEDLEEPGRPGGTLMTWRNLEDLEEPGRPGGTWRTWRNLEEPGGPGGTWRTWRNLEDRPPLGFRTTCRALNEPQPREMGWGSLIQSGLWGVMDRAQDPQPRLDREPDPHH